MVKLLIVTVNYFSSGLIEKLLTQLADQSSLNQVEFNIVCIDNSCDKSETDKLVQIQASSKLEFELFFNHANLGYGRAINDAVVNREFDYLCCINPDVSLSSDTLHNVISHAKQHEKEGIWGGLTIDKKLLPDYRHAWRETTLRNALGWAFWFNKLSKRAIWHDDYQYAHQDDTPYPVDSVSGCFFLISLEAWQSLKGFDTDFFLYSEEIDLCHRSRRLGFQPTIVPSSLLHHKHHDELESKQRIQIIYKSKLLYAQKHHGKFFNFTYRAIITIGSLLRAVGHSLRSRFSIANEWLAVCWISCSYRSKNFKYQQ